MPKEGFTSLTISKETNDLLEERARKNHRTKQEQIEYMLELVGSK